MVEFAKVLHASNCVLPWYFDSLPESAKMLMITAVDSSKDPSVWPCSWIWDSYSVTNTHMRPCQQPQSPSIGYLAHQTTFCLIYLSKLSIRNTLTIGMQALSIQVQSKFQDIVALEPTSWSWNQLITGLPPGQLSFLLQDGTDCLSSNHTDRWRYI